MFTKILTTFASISTAVFGIWHFFVPAAWNWYDHISPQAPELALAVRNINIFFSLCLVLFGVINIIFIYFHPERFSLLVMLTVSSILWILRCTLQIIQPQGSFNPWVQYGMLVAFVIILLCYIVSLYLVYKQKYSFLKTKAQ